LAPPPSGRYDRGPSTVRRTGSAGGPRAPGERLCPARHPRGTQVMQPLLRPILDDEALTRHLGDAEARMLVEWLVERAERVPGTAVASVAARVAALCRRARAIGLFVGLWCYRGDRGAAGQLAGAERFRWPLPPADVEPCALMDHILRYEGRDQRLAAA